MTDNNKNVGYRNPPQHSRFKKGKSGNPKGRPKGTRNMATLFKEIMREKVHLKEGEQVRRVTKEEAILRGFVLKGMKGDPKTVEAILRLSDRFGRLDTVIKDSVVTFRFVDGPGPDQEEN